MHTRGECKKEIQEQGKPCNECKAIIEEARKRPEEELRSLGIMNKGDDDGNSNRGK